MKRFILYLTLILVLPATAAAQKVDVHGSLSDAPEENSKIILSFIQGNKAHVLDTVALDAKGNFRFSIAQADADMYLLQIPGPTQPAVIHLMLVGAKDLTLDLRYHSMFNFLELAKVKGSQDMQLYQQFNQIQLHYLQLQQSLGEEFNQQGTSDQRRQAISTRFAQLEGEQKADVERLIAANTDKLMDAFLVTFFENDFEHYVPLYDSVAKGLKASYGNHIFVRHVADKVSHALVPGMPAPDIAMNDKDGKQRKLSDLRGKVVLVDFWASWCRPCRMENPNVVKLYQKYHDKGFDIFSVSLDKERSQWLNAISQDHLVWDNHVSDLNGWTSSGGASYGITSIPSTVLIDREGKIIARNLRGSELANKLQEIFGE